MNASVNAAIAAAAFAASGAKLTSSVGMTKMGPMGAIALIEDVARALHRRSFSDDIAATVSQFETVRFG